MWAGPLGLEINFYLCHWFAGAPAIPCALGLPLLLYLSTPSDTFKIRRLRQSCGRILLSVFLFLSASVLHAQTGSASLFSNIRYRNFAVTDTIRLDSLSVVPASVVVSGVPDSQYYLVPATALLIWRRVPALDSVHIRYRVLPVDFGKVYVHKSRKLIDSNIVSLIYRMEDQDKGNFVNLNQLDYNGSYGRSISLGNNQDVVLNSQFNLQANGYILDSIRLEAAITDNSVPFQPEGNTQRLQEFDQIYIRLSKKKHLLQLGDYNLESPPGYFLKYFKRVQGVFYQTEFPLSRRLTNKVGLSGSVSKGQFARNIFQGEEGNQGPYKLSGNNGEQFFIVLAGTERVFVDNVLMQRGENADYVINYNTGEVRFMPRKMISKDSRIQVEFEYQDRNYLNSLLYGFDEVQVGKKLNIRFNAYSNQDAKNQPYLQSLNAAQKQFLAGIGDSVQNAFYPNFSADTFADNKILYRMTDTVVGGLYYDSVFVYSTQPDSTLYNVGFSFVGSGKGDYIISSGNANGRAYDWVAPVNGQRQGNYAPVQLLITPKKQQVFTLTSHYQIDSLKSLNIEIGTSNYDPNLFSKRDDQNHWGVATKVQYDERRKIKAADTGKQDWIWQNHVSYEYVQSRFRAIAPYRNVEFGRDWNVPLAGEKPDEHLTYLSTRLQTPRSGAVGYTFSGYLRGTDYRGYKNILSYDFQSSRWKAGFVGNVLVATDTFQYSRFYRPSVLAEYFLPRLMKTYAGVRYQLEHDEIRQKHSDTLLPASFSFDISSAWLRTADGQKTFWSINYFTRRDRIPYQNKLLQIDHSHNVEIRLGLSQWKNHLINFTGSYRKLIIDDTAHTRLLPEETLLGRLEYSGHLAKNAFGVNSLYEFGSGQEQRRSYTFVEVPAGQGMYMWNDYNGDGVQQANEFELALYPDQKRFIKVFTATNEYVKVNFVNFNFMLTIDPAVFWYGKEQNALKKFISRLSSQTSVQIGNRLLAGEGLRAYNPFVGVLSDTSIIITNTSLSNSIYFNRSDPRWGLDYNLIYNAGKQLLTYGIEGSQSSQHLYKLRWNIVRPVTVTAAARHGHRYYASALDDGRSYRIAQWSAEPSITWLHQSVLRITGGLKYEQRTNEPAYGGEEAVLKSGQLELRYSKAALGVIQLRGTFTNIDFDGKITAPVAFSLLESLQPGANYLWYMNWQRRVGNGIEISLEYEGRKPGASAIIHTGRMSIRAIL